MYTIHWLCFVCCDSTIEKSSLNFIDGNIFGKIENFICFLEELFKTSKYSCEW